MNYKRLLNLTILPMLAFLVLLGCISDGSIAESSNETASGTGLNSNGINSSNLEGDITGNGTETEADIPVELISARSFQRLIDDDSPLGSNNAPVIVIEFADFQCPYSREWWTRSFIIFEREYIDMGKVQFIYKDFPLPRHPSAQMAAEAAECAREQGKWKEMHDSMFREQNSIRAGIVTFGQSELEQWAGSIEGLDMKKFGLCMTSRTYKEEVWDDYSDGSAINVGSTPTFVIGKRNGAGEIIRGSYSYSSFSSMLDKLLE